MASAEQKLPLNALEARGVWLLQQNVLACQQQADRAMQALAQAEQVAAASLEGRVPAGVTVRHLRIDEQKGEVWAPLGSDPVAGG